MQCIPFEYREIWIFCCYRKLNNEKQLKGIGWNSMTENTTQNVSGGWGKVLWIKFERSSPWYADAIVVDLIFSDFCSCNHYTTLHKLFRKTRHNLHLYEHFYMAWNKNDMVPEIKKLWFSQMLESTSFQTENFRDIFLARATYERVLK